MEATRYDHYILIHLEKNTKIQTLTQFLDKCNPSVDSLIIDMLDSSILDDIIVTKLLPFHFSWQKTNNSFILVSNIRKKSLNDMISIHTLEEALDFFHMEQLTRNI